MVKQHEHKWRKMYFRKPHLEKDYQKWIPIKDKFICEICLEIRELK